METWAIITLVLGSSAISAFLTFFITKMQVSHSNRRFEKELEQIREENRRKRRWEVRGEPLLKLRAALALMATKLQILVTTTTQLQHNRSDSTEEEVNKEPQRAVDAYTEYMTSGDFLSPLYIQYDEELLELVKEIENGYLLSFDYALQFKQLKPEENREFRHTLQNTKDKIPKVQEVINKRLEEL